MERHGSGSPHSLSTVFLDILIDGSTYDYLVYKVSERKWIKLSPQRAYNIKKLSLKELGYKKIQLSDKTLFKLLMKAKPDSE